MSKLRLLSTLALGTVLLVPTGVALAQEESERSPVPAVSIAPDDPRLEELQALVPPALAGLPLYENLIVATGEEIISVMSPEEAAIFDELLTSNGKTPADYAAAATWLEPSETERVDIQVHRIAGIEAAQTIDAWVEILSLNVAEPEVSEGYISGAAVTLVSDASVPESHLLHMFPAGDMVWMMWAGDQAYVEDAIDQTGADATEAEEDDEAEE